MDKGKKKLNIQNLKGKIRGQGGEMIMNLKVGVWQGVERKAKNEHQLFVYLISSAYVAPIQDILYWPNMNHPLTIT